jgi:AraC-like DNA-binding protein
MEQLLHKLRQLQSEKPSAYLSAGPPDLQSFLYGSAFETRACGEEYFWHGLKRGGDPAHPFVIFQYTLEGSGVFLEQHRKQRLGPQMAFTAIVPSDHAYYLPADSIRWSFFWLNISHPYIVSRIEHRMKTVGPLLRVPPESILLLQAYKLLASLYQAPFPDPFREEQALFDFLIEYERTAFHLRYPSSEREQLLQHVRAVVSGSLRQPLGVEELAKRYGMSRSHFSHYFKSMTGTTPARFIIQVRLDEAIHLLLHTPRTLEEVANETGFADANHLCKVFRRFLYMSPGEWRSQIHSPLVGKGFSRKT